MAQKQIYDQPPYSRNRGGNYSQQIPDWSSYNPQPYENLDHKRV